MLRAFTLIEILVAISIAATIGSIGFTEGISSYERDESQSDTEVILSALMRARAESFAGVCNSESCETARSHGVYLTPHEIVIFEGSSYATRSAIADDDLPLSGEAIISPQDEIVFAADSGHVATTTTIEWSEDHGGKSETVILQPSGQIEMFDNT